jgi:hypothetical protein
MSREASVAGDGFRLLLRVLGYERPALESGADANWLTGEAELTASESFSGTQAVALRTDELAVFRDELERLVAQLDGEATLSHMEGQVGCTIRLSAGAGEFSGFVRQNVGAELRVKGRTDQSYLQGALRDFDALTRAFPVKGDPVG